MLRGAIRDRKVTLTNGMVVDVPRRITMLRHFRDMTQEELAKKLGVTQSCVCSWEKGRSTPSNEMIHRFCHVIDIPVAMFVTGGYPYIGR